MDLSVTSADVHEKYKQSVSRLLTHYGIDATLTEIDTLHFTLSISEDDVRHINQKSTMRIEEHLHTFQSVQQVCVNGRSDMFVYVEYSIDVE